MKKIIIALSFFILSMPNLSANDSFNFGIEAGWAHAVGLEDEAKEVGQALANALGETVTVETDTGAIYVRPYIESQIEDNITVEGGLLISSDIDTTFSITGASISISQDVFGFDVIGNYDFNNGFTALTGETGAGKSLLLDALDLLLGGKQSHAYSSILRDSTKACYIEANFLINPLTILSVIKFSSNDCGTCHKMSHYDKKVSEELGYSFISVVLQDPVLYRKYRSILLSKYPNKEGMGWPTYLIVSNPDNPDFNIVGEIKGGMPKGDFRNKLKLITNS